MTAPTMAEAGSECTQPPQGWACTRAPGHDGPCAAIPVTSQKPTAPSHWSEGQGKYGSALSFEGGVLLINVAGYGARDGNAVIAFKPADVSEDDEGYLCVGLPNSELIAIRDELNRWFPPVAEPRAAELEGHIRDFIRALDRGYLDCKDDSAFIDALRNAVAK